MKILETTTADTMTKTFTDYQIVEALLALSDRSIMTKPAPKKKQRKTLIKEKRAMALKAWHANQTKKKTISANRSAMMSKWWADRKAAKQQTQ